MADPAIHSAQKLVTHKIAGALGAEISGVDLAGPLDDQVFAGIHAALLEHLVIFFRDQQLTPEQHIAFGRRFGELHVHPYIPNLEGYPEIIKLKSADDGPGEMAYQSNTWHTDLTYSAEPPMASILYGVVVPEAGGDTMWNNLYAAYEGLSPKLRAFVDDLTAVHNIVTSMPVNFMEQNWAPDQLKRLQEITPPVEHPVVRTHPETGRRCLFVNRNFTSHIKELSRFESDALLRLLYEHIEQPEHVVRFHWREGSLAMWDNRCTQHYALTDYRSLRVMHRVTVCGDRPV
jgi:taurine dioxygenase